MKVKRQKRVRKALQLYKITFGLVPPYHVLIDGTFCKAALKFQVNIAEQLPKYLDAEVKIKTTICVLKECRAFGSLLYGPLKVLSQFEVEPCKHGGQGVPAARCLRRLAKKPDRHYMVATQDPELSNDVRSIPKVPLLFISHNAINLEVPNVKNASDLSSCSPEETTQVETEMDRLKELKKKVFGEQEPVRKKKRKGPKGPNPLSCKKKAKKPNQKTVTQPAKKRRKKHKKRALSATVTEAP